MPCPGRPPVLPRRLRQGRRLPRGTSANPGDHDQLKAACATWNDTVQALIYAAPSLTVWPMYDPDPLRPWYTRRIALLGDAAHHMQPHMAQAGNQAIEDAVVLTTCLSCNLTAPHVALAAYQALRAPRIEAAYTLSRSTLALFHCQDGDDQRRP